MFTSLFAETFAKNNPGYSLETNESGQDCICYGEGKDKISATFGDLYGLCLFHGMTVHQAMEEVKHIHDSNFGK